jgi:TRAP-type C4-dicarboxylate transport system substrate-binding protein
MRTIRRLGAVALAAGLAALCAGCGAGAGSAVPDKAGGAGGPVVLSLAASDGSYVAESRLATYFADQVARLSGGKLRVEVTFAAAGNDAADVEARTIELVRSGRFDLGWVAARAWDEVGVRSFQALQAPFLITSYPLLDRVLTSPLARSMLAGLDGRGVVGLALVPGLLRHPIGIERPLVSLADFAGARVRDLPSKTTDAMLRALGAVPVHVGNTAMAHVRVDGEELSIANAPIDGIVTANVAFFPKVMTLFAGKRVFAGLSAAQRHILRAAAERTVKHNASFPVRTALAFEGVLARGYCLVPGRVVLATAQELSTLVRASRPVYAQMDRDLRTRAQIARIRALKASIPSPPPIVVPSGCLGPKTLGLGAQRSPGILNGTYHRLLTAAAARAFGPPATDPGDTYPQVITTVLRDGRWTANSDQPPDVGTYGVSGNEVVFRLGRDVMRFTFSRDPDGTLHLRAIPPMNRGDEFVMASAPWIRVGPPTGRIP